MESCKIIGISILFFLLSPYSLSLSFAHLLDLSGVLCLMFGVLVYSEALSFRSFSSTMNLSAFQSFTGFNGDVPHSSEVYGDPSRYYDSGGMGQFGRPIETSVASLLYHPGGWPMSGIDMAAALDTRWCLQHSDIATEMTRSATYQYPAVERQVVPKMVQVEVCSSNRQFGVEAML